MRCTAAFFLSARSDALYGCLSVGRELIACICDVLWRSLARNCIYAEELVLKFNSRKIVRASVVNWNEVTLGVDDACVYTRICACVGWPMVIWGSGMPGFT